MSRLPADRGWAKPDGKCRQCQGPVSGRRRTFCSDECVHLWKCRTDPTYQAKQVLKRDAGICEGCQLNCVLLVRELWKLVQEEADARAGRPGAPWYHLYLNARDLFPRFAARCDELGLSEKRRVTFQFKRLWEMDHRVPVAEGGGGCGLENLRTLCWKCHARVSGELRKRLNAAKKAAQG